MQQKVSEDLYRFLSPVIEIYPVAVVLEEKTEIKYPCAVYQVKEQGLKTKDGTGGLRYEINIMLWCRKHGEIITKTEEIKGRIEAMIEDGYNVTYVDSTSGFDGDDRLYYGEINYLIKKF